MQLSFFNTLGRAIQPFEPLNTELVGFYGCGPTVYNFAHIGNLRAYVTHDLLVRTLRRAGYATKHVMNITDVGHLSGDDDSGDDKMVRSAEERGKSVLEVAAFYTDAFFKDTTLLNIRTPDVVCRATEHVDDMIALIRRIEANGFTYFAGGNLYFDITKFPTYGELARLRMDEQKAGTRTDVDGNKHNPHDFVLWFTKSKFENQALIWDSPWGRGYPGWHIECSAMSMKYLGESFDIHAGGIDHIAIHHTNEIAQSEAATGKKWVRYWMHNEFLVLNRGKMSKSQGGFLTLRSLTDAGYDPLDYRYFLLGGHYRSQLQFSFEALDGARNSRRSLAERIRTLVGGIDIHALDLRAVAPDSPARVYLESFDRHLGLDLSTPRALAELWGVLRDPAASAADVLAVAFDMDEVLGLDLRKAAMQSETDQNATSTATSEDDIHLAEEVGALIVERIQAKKDKDFKKADGIRDALKNRGIVLEDGPAGTVWRRS